jgi:tripartite-type tricarboxylate transporter receptor subunit TctC
MIRPHHKEATMRLRLVLALVAALALPAGVAAQPYPSKPIRFIAPFAAGGALDTLTRTIASRMQDNWGQPVLVENRTGAGGNIGADIVAKAAPDGYTLVMGTIATHAINVSLYAKMPYDAVKDFAPVTLAASINNSLSLNPAVPARNVSELIAHAKANPGKLTFGSAGSGTSQHLAGELFKTMAGVDMVHVPYKGGALAVIDLLGGQISMTFGDIPTALPHIRSGKLRSIAVTAAKRSPLLPDVPTIAEQGLPGFDVSAWFGVFTTAGTPRAVVDQLNTEIVRILNLPDVREKLAGIGMDVVTDTPDQFAAFVQSEIAKWSPVVKASGAKAQ